MSFDIDWARERAREILEAWELGDATLLEDRRDQEVVPGVLFRVLAHDPDLDLMEVQIYASLSPLAGLMWDRETRALLKLSARAHPALPRILDADYFEDRGLAYVVASCGVERFDDLDVLAEARDDENREMLFGMLTELASGLAELHAARMLHRNLQPSSIELLPARDGRHPAMRLCGFQMASLLGDLARRLDHAELNSHLRQSRDLRFMAPEVAALLSGGEHAREVMQSDVYSLGVVLVLLLIGDLPSLSKTSASQDERLAGELQSYQTGIRDMVRKSRRPEALRELLLSMLSAEPRERPTAHEVSQQMRTRSSWLLGKGKRRPHLLMFMPEESRSTLYKWGWIKRDPSTPEGRRELRTFLTADLRGASAAQSDDGFLPFGRALDQQRRRAFAKATTVLLGSAGAYFCERYRFQTRFGGLGKPSPHALVIKYVTHRSRVEILEDGGAIVLPAPEFELHATTNESITARSVEQQFSSWIPFQTALGRRPTLGPDSRAFMESMQWFQQYRRCVIRAREYAFECLGEDEHGRWKIKLDRKRDLSAIHRDRLLTEYANRFRPAFSRFFQLLMDEDREDSRVEWTPDRDGRRTWSSKAAGRGTILETDANTVLLERLNGARIPRLGWIRPRVDHLSMVDLRRQADAIYRLQRQPGHIESMVQPIARARNVGRWDRAGRGLLGGADEIVQTMLATHPVYTLQGPPGTGKTTVAAAALVAALEQDPSLRVLVTAQSHHALDNLAVRIMDKLEPRGITAVRWATKGSSNRVHARMQQYEPSLLTQSRVSEIRQRSGTSGGAEWGHDYTDLLQRWHHCVQHDLPQVQRRLTRGANIVFSTCSAAAQIETGDGAADFDWVIIEEAAKAWPAELAIAMVRGRRWTLIGDDKQLDPYQFDEVTAFLDYLQESDGSEEQGFGEEAAEVPSYADFFKLFSWMQRSGGPKSKAMLTMQFRMEDPIGRLVSDVFYGGEVVTGPGVDDGVRPALDLLVDNTKQRLGEARRYWVNTPAGGAFGGRKFEDLPRWRNPGEAGLVGHLLRAVVPSPRASRRGYSDTPIAVLSPYRSQCDDLRNELGFVREWGLDVDDVVHTFDSFQGREADIVILSLVRCQARYRDADGTLKARASYGHLLSPLRVNVAFSRARHLLIVVGSWSHFRDAPPVGEHRDDFWRRLTTSFDYGTHIIDARRLGPGSA